MNYLREDIPISLDQLVETEVDFDVAVESIFFDEVHYNKPKWSQSVSNMSEWYEITRMLVGSNIYHTGYDYPDWRQFALLDLARPTRTHLRTRKKWYNDIDWGEIENIVDTNIGILESDDVLSIMARIRIGLKKETYTENDPHILNLYMFGLLYSKYMLCLEDINIFDTLLPIYSSLYSLFLVKFDIHPHIFRNNSFWCMHSTLSLFPYEVTKLDIGTFKDKRSWLVNSMGLANKAII